MSEDSDLVQLENEVMRRAMSLAPCWIAARGLRQAVDNGVARGKCPEDVARQVVAFTLSAERRGMTVGQMYREYAETGLSLSVLGAAEDADLRARYGRQK